MNKKLIKILSCMTLSTLLFTACAKAPKDAMVKIGNVYITEKQVTDESKKIIETFDEEQKKSYDEATEEGKNNILSLNQRILDTMANAEIIKQKMKLLYDQAKKDGKNEEELKAFTVSDDEIKDQLAKIKEQIGGEEKFNEELKKFKITEDELKVQLMDQEYNRKFELWFNNTYKPTAEEINKLYVGSEFEGPEIEASHILVETEDEAKKVIDRLKSGEKLEDIAKDVSKDPSAQTNNGKLGKFTKGVMVPEFYDAASKLKPGEISEPVKTTYGFHVIKVDAIESDYTKFSDEAKSQIEQKLSAKVLQEKFKEEFEKIKKEIGVYPIKSFNKNQ